MDMKTVPLKVPIQYSTSFLGKVSNVKITVNMPVACIKPEAIGKKNLESARMWSEDEVWNLGERAKGYRAKVAERTKVLKGQSSSRLSADSKEWQSISKHLLK